MKLATYIAQLAAVVALADITIRHPNLAVAGSGAWLAALGCGAVAKARWRL